MICSLASDRVFTALGGFIFNFQTLLTGAAATHKARFEDCRF